MPSTDCPENFPERSAVRIITARQVIFGLAFICSTILGLVLATNISVLVFHILASIFYLAVTLMRAAMIVSGAKFAESPPVQMTKSPSADRELPIYTILVALYKEAGQVEELVDALANIDWPQDRLQILLVCEADDPDTVVRCHRYNYDERFQTVICPVSHPRTKPKALNFALPQAKGQFLVLFDAEDRPHPLQLREAYAKFLTDGNYCLFAGAVYLCTTTGKAGLRGCLPSNIPLCSD